MCTLFMTVLHSDTGHDGKSVCEYVRGEGVFVFGIFIDYFSLLDIVYHVIPRAYNISPS